MLFTTALLKIGKECGLKSFISEHVVWRNLNCFSTETTKYFFYAFYAHFSLYGNQHFSIVSVFNITKLWENRKEINTSISPHSELATILKIVNKTIFQRMCNEIF